MTAAAASTPDDPKQQAANDRASWLSAQYPGITVPTAPFQPSHPGLSKLLTQVRAAQDRARDSTTSSRTPTREDRSRER